MKSNNLSRLFSLFVQGYMFGASFARHECRRIVAEWLNAAGTVGAWLLTFICTAAIFYLLYLFLWFGYEIGMTM